MQHDIGDNNIVTKRNASAGDLNGAVEAWAEWLFDGERRLRNEIFFYICIPFRTNSDVLRRTWRQCPSPPKKCMYAAVR